MAEDMRQVPEVQAAAKPAKHEKYPWPDKPTILGTAVKRLDGPVKATGRAKYPYDMKRPGMLWGKILRSPHPHARVIAIDVSAAEKAPGVKAVLPWRKPGEKVVYQGDEVACLAAQTEEQGLDALRLARYRGVEVRARARLLTEGAVFTDAYLEHYPTVTAIG